MPISAIAFETNPQFIEFGIKDCGEHTLEILGEFYPEDAGSRFIRNDNSYHHHLPPVQTL
jgi:hypothetical protein